MKFINNIFSRTLIQNSQQTEERIGESNQLPRSKKLFLIPGVVLLLLILILIITKFLIEPTASPQNVFISNVSNHQATVSWMTSKATRGTVVISDNGSFPILPLFAKNNLFRDDGEKDIKKSGFYTTHHVTTENLSAGREYQFRIYQGWKKVYQGKFFTGPTLPTLANPNPVYGRIVGPDRKTPIVGALVYLTVQDSSILSVLTNSEGRWSIDLGNLRSKDLKSIQSLTKLSIEQIMVDAGNKGRVKAVSKAGADKPWPDTVIGTK